MIAIRPETPADEAAIHALTAEAFRDMPISEHTEQFIVDALRRAGVLTLSLVAEDDGVIVGHAAFSPVTVDGRSTRWFGLGPVSVLPDRQRSGIGTALIEAGLAALRERGAGGCVVVGWPAYYPRFGFRPDGRMAVVGVPPDVFMILPFGDHVPAGTVAFHPAFAATA